MDLSLLSDSIQSRTKPCSSGLFPESPNQSLHPVKRLFFLTLFITEMLVVPSGVHSPFMQCVINPACQLQLSSWWFWLEGLTCFTSPLLHLWSERPVVNSHGDGRHFTLFSERRHFWLRIPAENRFLYSTEPWHLLCNTIKSPLAIVAAHNHILWSTNLPK